MRDLATFPTSPLGGSWFHSLGGIFLFLLLYVEIITGSQEPADKTRHSRECQIPLVPANDELSIQSIK